MLCVLRCGMVACYFCYVYCVVVWQRDMSMLCVFCVGLSARCMYGLCNMLWCGKLL